MTTLYVRTAIIAAVMGASNLTLTGCAVPALVLATTVFSVGATGYVVYRTSSGASASFDVERSDPDASSLATIRSARRLVLYPFGNDFDGSSVDILRGKLNMEVVSPTDAAKFIGSRGGLRYAALPADEKAKAAAQLGQATGADVVLTVEDLGQRSENNFLTLKQAVINKVRSSLIDTRTSRTLWTELQQVTVDFGGGGGKLSAHEIYRVGFLGLSDRLIELRTGQKPTTGQLATTAVPSRQIESQAGATPSGGQPNQMGVSGQGAEQPSSSNASSPPRVLTDRESIRFVQQTLKSRGLYKGVPDGLPGPTTSRAVMDYQKSQSIVADGVVTDALLSRLRGPSTK